MDTRKLPDLAGLTKTSPAKHVGNLRRTLTVGVVTLEVVPSPLPLATAAAVTELARLTALSDGVHPLSERTLLHLESEHADDAHFLAYDGEAGSDLIGYAFLDPDGSAELFVVPSARRRGTGSALLRMLRDHGGANLRVWAHGRLAGVDELASRLDLGVVRELYYLQRTSAEAELPEPSWPAGIELRTFAPGRDEDAWLRVNARAFADHPEQGRWGRVDLAERMHQPWFDPKGFFLAVDRSSGELAGFHWTKVHEDEGDGPYGEVYVIGVDPDHQGTGLGKALTIAGIRYLQQERGLATVGLYVDGTNKGARALYDKLGFTVAALDVQFAPR